MTPSGPESDYAQASQFRVTLAGQEFPVFSKPGIPHWNVLTPAESLLAEAALPAMEGRCLLLGPRQGALGVFLARQPACKEIWLMDTSFLALEMAEQTLEANRIQNAWVCPDISLPQGSGQTFDRAVMQLPKGRKLAQRWLLAAWTALGPGGQLFLAGANQEGVQSAIKDAAQLFGNHAILGYKKGNRVARLVKTLHPPAGRPLPAWAQLPGVAPGTWHELEIPLPGPLSSRTLRLSSLPGIFSYDRLDEGSRLLLEHLEVPREGTVLDLGCGYGVLGLCAALAGAAHVDLVDANLLAVAAARRNLKRLGIENGRALTSDVASSVRDQRYDLVLTNPPFHTGKAVDYQVALAFIHQAYQVLKPGGRFLLVANKFIRYNQEMRARFGNFETFAETGKYHLLSSTKHEFPL